MNSLILVNDILQYFPEMKKYKITFSENERSYATIKKGHLAITIPYDLSNTIDSLKEYGIYETYFTENGIAFTIQNIGAFIVFHEFGHLRQSELTSKFKMNWYFICYSFTKKYVEHLMKNNDKERHLFYRQTVLEKQADNYAFNWLKSYQTIEKP